MYHGGILWVVPTEESCGFHNRRNTLGRTIGRILRVIPPGSSPEDFTIGGILRVIPLGCIPGGILRGRTIGGILQIIPPGCFHGRFLRVHTFGQNPEVSSMVRHTEDLIPNHMTVVYAIAVYLICKRIHVIGLPN